MFFAILGGLGAIAGLIAAMAAIIFSKNGRRATTAWRWSAEVDLPRRKRAKQDDTIGNWSSGDTSSSDSHMDWGDGSNSDSGSDSGGDSGGGDGGGGGGD